MDKWINVKDKLPEIGTSVLTYPHYRALPFGRKKKLQHNETDKTFWEWDDQTKECKVVKHLITHWMPLPDRPTDWIRNI